MDVRHVETEALNLPGLRIHEPSVTRHEGAMYCLVDGDGGQRRLAVLAPAGSPQLAGFDGEHSARGENVLLLAPLSAENAVALRSRLAWLQPSVLGLRTAVGLGDRLGLATPGQLRAVRAAGGRLAPLPAQQSIREMSRTGRSPQQVMDDAMWGVFAEGWRAGFGADADHLKTPEDVDRCLAAGYTFYTVDPGEHVDNAAESAPAHELRARLGRLPWEHLEDTSATLVARYLSKPFECEDNVIRFDELTLVRAAVKYGRAIAHVAMLYRHLAQVGARQDWEVEVSVDETEAPTTHAEHVYIATELRRLGVRWVSLAPRYIGRFEKGVDYIGDTAAFERDFAVHAAIARTLGPYKLSLHSGSDKFSIYEASARQTRGLVQLKTAGTSYLEALRTIAVLDPDLLRSIYVFAREHYEVDRASYHVSAQLDRAPAPEPLPDAALLTLLEQFDAREILHVTFGSVLTAPRFYDRLMGVLRAHPEAYAANLRAHFLRHLRPFAPWTEGTPADTRAQGT
jgi:tagaturonate epimerase